MIRLVLGTMLFLTLPGKKIMNCYLFAQIYDLTKKTWLPQPNVSVLIILIWKIKPKKVKISSPIHFTNNMI